MNMHFSTILYNFLLSLPFTDAEKANFRLYLLKYFTILQDICNMYLRFLWCEQNRVSPCSVRRSRVVPCLFHFLVSCRKDCVIQRWSTKNLVDWLTPIAHKLPSWGTNQYVWGLPRLISLSQENFTIVPSYFMCPTVYIHFLLYCIHVNYLTPRKQGGYVSFVIDCEVNTH